MRRALLTWYGRTARDFPWRCTRDPYAVLVSEIMLQQTQASRVVAAYESFLARFPDVDALADASPAEVLTAWRGLGYNRRALALQAAARAVVERHGGVVPDDYDALRALPGVGDYTARAVLAFAYDRDVAPVDTNIARVLSRTVAEAPLGRAALQRLADSLVPRGRGRDWSLALMDLGATVCTARSPKCGACPVRRQCAWRGADAPDPATQGAARPRPQPRFAGSDRYHRGRIVEALRAGSVPRAHLGRSAELPDGARLEAILAGLLADGLVEEDGGSLRLPYG